MSWLVNLIAFSLAVFIVAQIMPGVRIRGFGTTIVVAVAYGIINFFFYWFFVILSLPFIIVSLGLFLVLINAFLLWLTNKVISGFEVRGFFTTIIASVLISILSGFFRWILPHTSNAGSSSGMISV